jgi:FMN-dependent NADH-azoreductase
VLGSIGLTDVTFIAVEGQGRGPEAAARGLADARNLIDGISSSQPRQRDA